MKKKLLLCSDFASPTGFATVAENVAKHLRNKWEIDILAVNYQGDAHPLQKEFNLYPASLGGDVYGLGRIVQLLRSKQYDLIFFINDIWIIDMFIDKMYKSGLQLPPIVWYTPVDAKHIKKGFVEPLNKTTYGIAYTEFGKKEILEGGLVTPIDVIPHGVDTTDFYFMPKQTARKETGVPEDWFIVLNVNRNQPRKRLDLQVYFFSEWVKRTNKPETVKLYYHGALQDIGWDLNDLMAYYGVDKHFMITSEHMTMANMLSRDRLKLVYNTADVFNTTCTSEGWGLTVMEAMACAIPCLIPNSSALAEWPNGGVEYIDVDTSIPFVNTGGVNTIMDTPKLESYIEKMELLYNNAAYRKDLGKKGWKLVTKDRFKWSTVAEQFDAVFNKALERHAAQNTIKITRS